ncbi:MAG: N-acetylmuramoyl-L-alanine amidase [Oscillospiraceae bacterium]
MLRCSRRCAGVALFALPPIYADEAEPATAEAETTRVLIIDAGTAGRTAARQRLRACRGGINLAIAQKLEALAGLCGVESVMTRESQDKPSASTTAQRKQSDQKARIELINAQSDAVLISIHQNFFPTAASAARCSRQAGGQPGMGELTHKNLTERSAPRAAASPRHI